MSAKPFVKWVGGKGQLIEQLSELLPRDFAERRKVVYVEPFVGGGAMLFHMLSTYTNIVRAVANDLNADLVTTYKTVRDKSEPLIASLKKMQREFYALADETQRRDYYLRQRERYNSHPSDGVEIAALFIFLNRTCFNGLYRVNAKGLYNVPYGKAVATVLSELDFRILNAVTWQKTNPPPNLSCRMFTHSTEIVLWARKSRQVPHLFNYDLMHRFAGGGQMTDVWKLPAIGRGRRPAESIQRRSRLRSSCGRFLPARVRAISFSTLSPAARRPASRRF